MKRSHLSTFLSFGVLALTAVTLTGCDPGESANKTTGDRDDSSRKTRSQGEAPERTPVADTGQSDPTAPVHRTALVIGNSDYPGSANDLPNPVNDARAIASMLEEVGFDQVMLRENRGLSDMKDDLLELKRAGKDGGIALFYYAGHGLMVDGINYLQPTDIKIPKAKDEIEDVCVAVEKVLDRMDASGNAFKVVMLDCCRNNPFESTRAGVAEKALKRMGTDEVPKGQLVVFATSPKEVAEDGAGSHSPFTAALLKHLKTPGVEALQLFKQVADDVQQDTFAIQKPEVTFTYTGNYFVVPGKAPAPTPTDPPAKEVFIIDTVPQGASVFDLEDFNRPIGTTPLEIPMDELKTRQVQIAAANHMTEIVSLTNPEKTERGEKLQVILRPAPIDEVRAKVQESRDKIIESWISENEERFFSIENQYYLPALQASVGIDPAPWLAAIDKHIKYSGPDEVYIEGEKAQTKMASCFATLIFADWCLRNGAEKDVPALLKKVERQLGVLEGMRAVTGPYTLLLGDQNFGGLYHLLALLHQRVGDQKEVDRILAIMKEKAESFSNLGANTIFTSEQLGNANFLIEYARCRLLVGHRAEAEAAFDRVAAFAKITMNERDFASQFSFPFWIKSAAYAGLYDQEQLATSLSGEFSERFPNIQHLISVSHGWGAGDRTKVKAAMDAASKSMEENVPTNAEEAESEPGEFYFKALSTFARFDYEGGAWTKGLEAMVEGHDRVALRKLGLTPESIVKLQLGSRRVPTREITDFLEMRIEGSSDTDFHHWRFSKGILALRNWLNQPDPNWTMLYLIDLEFRVE